MSELCRSIETRPNATIAISAMETQRLLSLDPAGAEARARKFLAEQPSNGGALLLLGAAMRRQGLFVAAAGVLDGLIKSQPGLVLAHFELALALASVGNREEAVKRLKHTIDLAPTFAAAWFALAEQLDALRRVHHAASPLGGAREAIHEGRPSVAEDLLRDLIGSQWEESGAFLLSIVLLAQERGRAALQLIEALLASDPGNGCYHDLRAAALFQAGEFEEAIAGYDDILKHAPDRPGAWMSYGRALRALGRQEQCVAAFKRAIELLPTWIEPYRVLASVKTYHFGAGEIGALRSLLARHDLPAMSYAELHFALGRALDDAGDYAAALDNYQESAALQRANIAYDARASTRWLRRELAVFTHEFLRDRAGWGCQADAPIFVVGMPRAGSTLVQEILCAHPAIERTGELRDITWMVARLDTETIASGSLNRYPELLTKYGKERFQELGEEYLERTLPHRKLGRPFFVDKYPGNFLRTGLIHLILPKAKIIDVRRHPLDCCFSCFKNYFPEGPSFSHDLTELGRYYADYVEAMAHFDDVLPGKVHRVIYEQLVENPEREVRRLLDYLKLPFDEQCLRFYENQQAVMTSSTEQVRMPINKAGVGVSRNYEKWLGPLKSALGCVLDAYPEAPKFFRPMELTMTVRLA